MKFHSLWLWILVMLMIFVQVHSLKYYKTPLKGIPGQGYFFECLFGSNMQNLNMLLDTGSANLVVSGANFSDVYRWYTPSDSSLSKNMGSKIKMQYRTGNLSGSMYQDVFKIKQLSVKKGKPFEQLPYRTKIAVITKADEFFGNTPRPIFDGVFGMGFSTTTIQSSSPKDKLTSPMDVSKNQLDISNQFMVRFCGAIEAIHSARSQTLLEAFDKTLGPNVIQTSGELVLGDLATEQAKVFRYVPIIGSTYYEITFTGIRVNNIDLVTDCMELNSGGAIIDTGTANILLPERVLSKLVDQIREHLEATEPSLIQANTSIFSHSSMFCYEVNGSDYEFLGAIYMPFPLIEFDLQTWSGDLSKVLRLQLSPQSYLRYLGVYKIDAAYKDCFAFAIGSSNGDRVVLGLSFLEGFDVVFNKSGRSIGFGDNGCPPNNLDHSIPRSQVIGVVDWSPDAAGHLMPHHCSPLFKDVSMTLYLSTTHIVLLVCAIFFIAFIIGFLAIFILIYKKRRVEALADWDNNIEIFTEETNEYGKTIWGNTVNKEVI